MKIVFATGNAHKLKEINEIAATQAAMPNNIGQDLTNNGVSFAAGSDIEFILPPEGFDPVEDGETFEENSLIKAREAARLSGMISLADDSGLCVEALNGAPGIHSARYAETAQARIDKLLAALDDVEQNNPSLYKGGIKGGLTRNAKFVCAMTLVDADGNVLFQTRGECYGAIAREQAGVNGFGYDPVFIPDVPPSSALQAPSPAQGRREKVTMAEMSDEEKNEISHRGRALKKVLTFIEDNILSKT